MAKLEQTTGCECADDFRTLTFSPTTASWMYGICLEVGDLRGAGVAREWSEETNTCLASNPETYDAKL
jgi:hypothetical protein